MNKYINNKIYINKVNKSIKFNIYIITESYIKVKRFIFIR